MSDAPGAPPRRAQCPHCLRPASTCLCGWVRPTPNDVDVLILQHPLEVAHAKGSARLLQLSLARCGLHVGETFDAAELRAWLHAPAADGSAVYPVLLYPDTPGRAPADRPSDMSKSTDTHAYTVSLPPPVQADGPEDLARAGRQRLVLLDGTWRKSLKMLHANAPLQALPRLALQAGAPSRYLIRKAPKPGQLSTLEAACMALSVLENAPERYKPLLAAFEAWTRALRTSSMDRQTTRLRPPPLAS